MVEEEEMALRWFNRKWHTRVILRVLDRGTPPRPILRRLRIHAVVISAAELVLFIPLLQTPRQDTEMNRRLSCNISTYNNIIRWCR